MAIVRDKRFDKYKPDKARYVLFSDEHGVLQGWDGKEIWWSITNSKKDDAVTVPDQAAADVLVTELKLTFKDFPEYRLIMVMPDLPNNRVSRGMCSKHLLPWLDPMEFIQN